MKRLIIVFCLLTSSVYGQYPNPLPSSGTLSINEIAKWMLDAGEISGDDYIYRKSLGFLKNNSHLANKSAPHSISDWYGYSPDPYAYIVPYPDANAIAFFSQKTSAVFSSAYYVAQTITIYYEYVTSWGNYGYGSVDLYAGQPAAYAYPPTTDPNETYDEIYISYLTPGSDGRKTFYTMAYIR